MKLSSYLDSRLIFVNINAKTKDEAIQILIDKTAEVDQHFAQHKLSIQEAILERERGISTAMGYGIALPHARVEGYHDVIVSVGVLQEPVACELATREQGWGQAVVSDCGRKNQESAYAATHGRADQTRRKSAITRRAYAGIQ